MKGFSALLIFLSLVALLVGLAGLCWPRLTTILRITSRLRAVVLIVIALVAGTLGGRISEEVPRKETPKRSAVDGSFDASEIAEAGGFIDAANCKVDVVCDAEGKWSIHPFRWKEDGGLAYLITHTERGFCGSGGCTDYLIVREGTAWKVVAAVFGKVLEVRDTHTNGVRDIAIGERRFLWNGSEYQPDAKPAEEAARKTIERQDADVALEEVQRRMKNELGTRKEEETKPSAMSPARRREAKLAPLFGVPLRVSIESSGEPGDALLARRFNTAISKLEIHKEAAAGRLGIRFLLTQNQCLGCRFLLRLFDRNGSFLTHFLTDEEFVMFPPAGGADRRADLVFRVNVRDLRDAEIAEFGYWVH